MDDHKKDNHIVYLTIKDVLTISFIVLGAIGTFILHNNEQQNDYIRHFHTNCKETHIISNSELMQLKNDVKNIQSELNVAPKTKIKKMPE